MKLAIALNSASRSDDLALLRDLKENLTKKEIENLYIKVGLQSFIRDGKSCIEDVKTNLQGAKIFLDLKLHDIPNTMKEAANFCADLEISILTVHASAGKKALEEVANTLTKRKSPPLVFGVTALTSFDEKTFFDVYNSDIVSTVKKLAKNCFEAGIDGVVCSAHESLEIKSITNNNFLTLCPGVRPFEESANDQKRVADLKLCAKNKADFIVIGRPIYESKNKAQTTQKILQKIASLKNS